MLEKNYTLLRSQKTRVYEILKEVGLEPAEFSWSVESIAGSLSVSRLKHRDGQYYFQFSSYELNAWCVTRPGLYRSMDYQHPKNWGEQEDFFRQWAECLRRELEVPDVWAEVARHRLSLDGELSGEAVNEPIPAVEADRIGEALSRFGDALNREFSLDEKRALLVMTKLNYLADAARRERSTDWMYMALGVWTSLAAALALPEPQAARFQAMAKAEWGAFMKLLRPSKEIPEHADKPERRILGIWPIGGRRSNKQDPAKSSPA